MRWVGHVALKRHEKWLSILPENGRNHFGGIAVDGTVMLKYILLGYDSDFIRHGLRCPGRLL
jgi:hypothetical protein